VIRVRDIISDLENRRQQSSQPGDINRILGLPKFHHKAPDLTNRYRLAGGEYSLFPIQSQALYEAYLAGGLFAMIGVGHGKTLVCDLLPRLWASERPVLLIPPQMADQYAEMHAEFSQHFALAQNVTVITYSKLSVASGAYLLRDIKPDLIIADEAHYLRHKTSSRTKRVGRYLQKNPDTRFCCLSGTLTNRSLRDYTHLIHWALGPNAPMPRDYLMQESWSACLDADGQPNRIDWGKVSPFFHKLSGPRVELNQENFRKVFRYRLVTTPGVVASRKGGVSASLIIHRRVVPVPVPVQEAIQKLARTWKAPNGEEIADALSYHRVSRQLSQGYYTVWDWGESGPNYDWLQARQSWHSEIRRHLGRNREGEDSMLLITNALSRGAINSSNYPGLYDAWVEWKRWDGFPEPPTVPVWINSWLVKDALQWAVAQSEPVIIWYSSIAVGELLSKAGVPTYGAGSARPKYCPKTKAIACSIAVHGTGKNLQEWSTQLIVAPPSSGAQFEQLLGRTHRTGQQADEVHATVYQHTEVFRHALGTARRDARYIQQTQGGKQKLTYATYTDKE